MQMSRIAGNRDGGAINFEFELKSVKRRGREPAKKEPSTSTARVPRVTRLMALAIKFQGMVERSEVRDYADLARLGHVTRARITQIMNLVMLAPDIQEHLLFATDEGLVLPPERQFRALVAQVEWERQRKLWKRTFANRSVPTGM